MITECKVFNQIGRNKEFIKYMLDHYGLDYNPENLKDAFDALKVVIQKFYPNPLNSWHEVSFREAEKMFDYVVITDEAGEIKERPNLSRTIIANKMKSGIFRQAPNGGVYREELEELKKALTIKNIFMDKKAILPSKTINGESVLAIIPESATKIGLSKLDQQFKALLVLFNDPLVKDWIRSLQQQ